MADSSQWIGFGFGIGEWVMTTVLGEGVDKLDVEKADGTVDLGRVNPSRGRRRNDGKSTRVIRRGGRGRVVKLSWK